MVRAIATASYLSLFWAVGVLMIKGKLDAGDFLILGSAMSAILIRANEALRTLGKSLKAPRSDLKQLERWIELGRKGLASRWDGRLRA